MGDYNDDKAPRLKAMNKSCVKNTQAFVTLKG